METFIGDSGDVSSETWRQKGKSETDFSDPPPSLCFFFFFGRGSPSVDLFCTKIKPSISLTWCHVSSGKNHSTQRGLPVEKSLICLSRVQRSPEGILPWTQGVGFVYPPGTQWNVGNTCSGWGGAWRRLKMERRLWSSANTNDAWGWGQSETSCSLVVSAEGADSPLLTPQADGPRKESGGKAADRELEEAGLLWVGQALAPLATAVQLRTCNGALAGGPTGEMTWRKSAGQSRLPGWPICGRCFVITSLHSRCGAQNSYSSAPSSLNQQMCVESLDCFQTGLGAEDATARQLRSEAGEYQRASLVAQW